MTDATEENMTVIADKKEKSPRVGDEYQIEIPSLISRSKYISETNNKFSAKAVDSESTNNGFSGKIENESLLLSLCIFKKDFQQIRKFLGCEAPYSIISFYYGNKFYKSDEYRKWSNCKKEKKGKVFFGKWIFNGFRLKILLSRLSAHVSKEHEKSISQASKLFNDRKMTLLEFVSTLKDITGIKSLVEAIAIGEGKKDIMRIARVPQKMKLDDLLDGITCFSSLTPAQILEFLSRSDIHKTKGESNNGLFWEAVWPLLLARGWHSEQTRSCYTQTQSSQVFLVPGIAKFSRRGGLVKGMHYFDSIPEVLNKVSSYPSLLEVAAWKEEPKTELENHDSMSMLCIIVVDTSRDMSNGKTFSTREVRLVSDESEPSISQTDSSMGEVNNNNINSSHTDSENGTVNDLVHGEPKEADWSSSEPAKKRPKKKISERPRPLMFDLNYPPPLPAGFDPYDIFVTNEEGGLDCNEPKKSSDEEEQQETAVVATIENGGGPRKSSRKGPPTTRVLEALANGSLITAGRSS